MDLPLVSIIMPVYNSEKFLAESITSALKQTWPNKEIILIDDGSKDNSLAIAKGFEAENVKIFSQKNGGASAARNKGLKEAKGDYIQFLDADDLLSPDKIEEQVKKLQQNPEKIAVCSTIHFTDDASLNSATPSPYEESFLNDDNDPGHFLVNLLGGYRPNGAMIANHSWLTPKTITDKAGPWDEGISVDDDGEFFARVMLNSSGIVKTKGYSYYRKYTNGNQSLSAGKNKKDMESIFRSISQKKKHLSAYSDTEAARRSIHKQLTILAVLCYSVHPELYQRVELELKNYPAYHYTPVLGGKFINSMAKLFGWKTTLKIKSLIK